MFSLAGKRKRSDQVVVKVSGSGSSLSTEVRLEVLKNQEVLGHRVFDPALANTPEMRDLLEIVKFQNWDTYLILVCLLCMRRK